MPGYRIQIDAGLRSKHLLCIICQLLLRAPVQTSCGHRCCLSCVKEKRGSSRSFICPEDNLEVTEVFPDRFVEREILNLRCKCEFAEDGCDWTGTVKEYEDHVAQCLYGKVACPLDECTEVISRIHLDRHLKTECIYRSEKCPNCDDYVKVLQIKKHHQTTCPGAKIKCSQCGKDVLRGQLEIHQERECDEAPFPCPFVKVGCAAKKPMKKNEKRKHMEHSQINHITYLLNVTLDLSAKVSELTAVERRDKKMGLPDSMEVEMLPEEVPTLQQDKELFQPVKAQSFGRVVSDSNLQSTSNRYSSLPVSAKSTISQDIYMKFTDELTAVKFYYDDMFKRVNRNIDALRDSLGRLDRRLVSFEDLQQKLAVNMAEINDKMEELETSNFNGTLIWPITNFMKKRHDSIVGKNVSLYSPYFYTSQYGYKMRLRVYLNGDGMGKGSHISLFFVVCKGRYDSLLPWPFKQNVKLTILDQDRVRDITEAFKPDPTSSSFKRPSNAMNVASGCPLFMPHNLLDTQAYLRDDTLYVKAEVDTCI